LAVLAFVAAGRDGAADRVVAALGGLRAASRSPVVSAVACWTAALREGDVGGLAAAAAALHAAGRQADAALAHHDAAVTAIRHGNPIEARAHAARAFAGFDDLGADHWHRRLRGELRRYGLELRPRRGPRRAAFGWGAITPSERAVIDAVAEGRTNTEIGERLFVSRRTVESHLGRIFTKLGCTNRNQLAAMRRAAEAVGGSGPAE
jgi:DNA-binding CsgD family transcriptional regulator